MCRILVPVMFALLCLVAACHAQDTSAGGSPPADAAPTTPATSVVTTATEAPSEAPASPEAPAVAGELDTWLDKIEARSRDVTTLRADLRYDRIQGLVGDTQRRFGKLVYIAGPPRQFAITFDRLLVGDRLERQTRAYVFDGRWLVERIEDKKQFFKRQVVAPDAPPEKADPLALGEGPFALPLTQTKAELLRRFDVTLQPAAEKDPENTLHLRLVPRAGQRAEFIEVDIWYDRDTLLPVKVRTIDESENESVVTLTKPRLNEGVEPAEVSTAEPTEPGWDVQITPWGK